MLFQKRQEALGSLDECWVFFLFLFSHFKCPEEILKRSRNPREEKQTEEESLKK